MAEAADLVLVAGLLAPVFSAKGLSAFTAGICAAGSGLTEPSSGVFAACEVGATSWGMLGLIRDPLSVLISDWEVLGFCNGPSALSNSFLGRNYAS